MWFGHQRLVMLKKQNTRFWSENYPYEILTKTAFRKVHFLVWRFLVKSLINLDFTLCEKENTPLKVPILDYEVNKLQTICLL